VGGFVKYVGVSVGRGLLRVSTLRELYEICTAMILLGFTGGRCVTVAGSNSRPSSSRRRPAHAPDSTIAPQYAVPLIMTRRRPCVVRA
jgi:hypothetical protein